MTSFLWISQAIARWKRANELQKAKQWRLRSESQPGGLALEPRRVLNAAPVVPNAASAQPAEVVINAGKSANDGKADTFVVNRSAAGDVVSVNGKVQQVVAPGSKLIIQGSGDADVVKVDFKSGNSLSYAPIQVIGNGGGDSIQISGSAGVVVHQFSADGSGQIVIDGAAISYSPGIAVKDGLTVGQRIFEISGAENASLTSDSASQVDTFLGQSGQSVEFHSSSADLQIQNAQITEEANQISISGFDSGVRENLTVIGDNADSVIFIGATNLQSGNLSVYSGTIEVAARIETRAANIGLYASKELIIDEAASITNEGGVIVADAGAVGSLIVSGHLDVSNLRPDQVGGAIHLLGRDVGLTGATIDARGDAGGGSILVGGDFQGKNSNVRNASVTTVDKTTTLNASAITQGNGGKVIVWSNEATFFTGGITTTGGSSGGNGGFAEVSSHNFLGFSGHFNALAPAGHAGTLLLDPTDLTIENTSDQNINASSPFVPTASPSVLTWGTIITALSGGDVVVTTSGSPDSGTETGLIKVADNSGDLGSANKLTLTAAGAVSILGTIQNTGTGALEINALGGDLSFVADVTLAGNLTTTSSGVTTIASTLSAASIDLTSTGNVKLIGFVNATAAGTVDLTATGAGSDVQILGDVTSGSGALTLKAGNNVTLNGNLSTTGAVNLTAGNAISQTSIYVISGGLLTTKSTTGTALGGTNQVTDFNATNSTSGDVSLTNSGALNITGIDETGGHVSVNNAGSMTVVGTVSTTGAGTIDLIATGAASDVALNADVTTGSGVVTVNAGNNVTLNAGNLTTTGAVNLTAGSSISEAAGGLITGGLLTTSSITGTILGNVNKVTGFNATNTTSGNVSLTNSGTLNVTGIDETGGNVVLNNAGTITVAGTLSASGAGTVGLATTGASSDIVLDADVKSGSGKLTLNAGNSVTLNAGNLTTTGDVGVTAGGAISESGTGLISGSLLTTSSASGTSLGNTNQVTSFNATNTTSGNVSLKNSGALNVSGIDETGGNVSLNNAGTITVAGTVSAADTGTVGLFATGASSDILVTADVKSGSGALTLNAENNVTLSTGNLTTTGAVNLTAGSAINESGKGFITGGLLTTSSTAGTTLDNTNQVTGFNATNTTSGDVRLTNGVALDITGIDETGGNVSVNNTGTITVSGTASAAGSGTVGLVASGATSDILLDADVKSGSGALTLNAGNNVTLNAGNVTTTGAVNVIAGSKISEAGAGVISGSLLATSSTTGTVLGNTNQVTDFSATNTTSGDISLKNSGALNVSGIDETGGNVSVNNAGTMTIAGLVSATATGTVGLTTTGVASDILVNADVKSGSGALTLNAGHSVTVNAGNLTTSGAVNITAGTAISESGTGLISGGLLTTSSTTGTTLGNLNQVTGFNATNTTSGDVSLTNSGSLDITGVDETGGNVLVNNAGSITVSGKTSAAGTGTVGLMATGATSDIQLDADVTSGSGALTLNAGQNVTLNAGNLTTTGAVNLTAGGAISESGTGLISGGLLTTTSTTGTLLGNTNQVTDFSATNTTSGDVNLKNSGSLKITSIDETGGNVSVNNAGTITVSGTVSTTGTGTVGLAATGATSDILVNADVKSGSGALTLSADRDVTLNAGNLNTGGTVNLNAGKTISESGAGLISGGLLTTTSTTGTSLGNSNQITDFNASNTVSGDISLTNSGTLNITGVTETGGDVLITAAGAINITGAIAAAGQTVGLKAANNITQVQQITASSVGAISQTGTVDLSLSSNDVKTFAASATAAGKDVNFQSAVGFEVGTVTSGSFFGAGLVGVTTDQTTGVVRLQSVTGDITQSAAITADKLGADAEAGSVLLANLNNSVTTFAAKAVATGPNTGGVVAFADQLNLSLGTVTKGGGETGGERLFGTTGTDLSGISAPTAIDLIAAGTVSSDLNIIDALSSSTIRLQSLHGAILEGPTGSIAATNLSAQAFKNIDLSQLANDVSNASFSGTDTVRFATVPTSGALNITQVAGDAYIGTSTGVVVTDGAPGNGKFILLVDGDVTQSEKVTATGAAILSSGSIDLSLPTNSINVFTAQTTSANKDINFQDSVGFEIGTVADSLLPSGTLQGISADQKTGTVRLQATSGDVTQTQAVISNQLGVVATIGKVNLALASNSVNVFAASAAGASQEINFQNAAGFDVGSVTKGGGSDPVNDPRLFSSVPGADLVGITAAQGTGTVRLQAATGDLTQSQSIVSNSLSAVATTGKVDLSLATNSVNVFAASAAGANQEIDFQNATGFEIGTVVKGGGFSQDVAGITTNQATGTIRLQGITGNISQTQAVIGNQLGVVASAGSVDLSLPTNSVNVFAASATGANQEVDFQNAIGFEVGTVSKGGGTDPVNNPRLFSSIPGTDLTGITTSQNSGTVRLQVISGNITQTGSVTGNQLGAVATTGTVDLSLASNKVNIFAAAATAANQDINFQNAIGFAVGTVSKGGGPDAVNAARMFTSVPGVDLKGISVDQTTGIVRLQSVTGDISQTAAITANQLGVDAKSGKALMSSLENQVGVFAANGSKVVFANMDPIKLGTVSAGGGPSNDRLFATTPGTALTQISGHGPGTNADEIDLIAVKGDLDVSSPLFATTIRLQSMEGAVYQEVGSAINAQNLAVQAAKFIDLTNAANDISDFAASADDHVYLNDVPLEGALNISTVAADAYIGVTSGITVTGANSTVALAVVGNVTQGLNELNVPAEAADRVSAKSLAVVATDGFIDLSLATNNVSIFAAQATAAGMEIDFQNGAASSGFDIGTVTTSPMGTLFTSPLHGIVTDAATGVVRLQTLNGDITQGKTAASGAEELLDSVTANQVGAVSVQGMVDLSLSSNQVKVFAGQAATEVNFQDSIGFDIGTVTAGGIDGAGDPRMFATVPGQDLIGITTTQSSGIVRLQATSGDITQSQAITTNQLGAVSLTGKVDLSLAANQVHFFAAAATGSNQEIDFQDSVGFEIGSVSKGGGPDFTNAPRMFGSVPGVDLNGITASKTTGTVRLQAVNGDILQSQAIVSENFGAYAIAGDVLLCNPANDINTVALKGQTVGFSSITTYAQGTITAGGGPTSDRLFATVDKKLTNITATVGIDLIVQTGDLDVNMPLSAITVKLQALNGAVYQEPGFGIKATNLAVQASTYIDLTNATNDVQNFAALARDYVYLNDNPTSGSLNIGTVAGDACIGATYGVSATGAEGTVALAVVGNVTQGLEAGTAAAEALDAVTAKYLGVVATNGNIDLSLATNNVAVFAAQATTSSGFINFQDGANASGFDIGKVVTSPKGTLFGGPLQGVTTDAATGTVRLEAVAGDITQSNSIVTYSLGAVSDQGKVDLSLPTNSVKVLAAKAVTEVNFQDTVGFDVGTVSAGGQGLSGGNRMFSGGSLSGITTGTASGDVVRLEALAGDITQSDSIVTYSLGAVSDQGKADLSLPTNSVKVLAAKAVTEVNFQDTVGFDVGTVSAGGTGLTGGNRMFSGSALSGITTDTVSGDVVRLEAATGNITQSDSIVTYSLGAVSDQGKVDLSLPTNSVKVLAAKAVTEVNFQDTVGFDVGTVSAGGTGLTGGNRMFSGSSLSGITTGTVSGDVVRLEAATGDITQSDSVVTYSLGAVSDQGKVDLSLPTNSVKVLAAKAVTEVNFQDTVGFDVGTVSAGGQGLTGGNRMFSGSALSGITTGTASDDVVRLEALTGNITQSDSVVTYSLGAVSDQGKVDLSLPTNNVKVLAAKAVTEVNFQDTVGFDVGTVSAGGQGLSGGNRMFSGSSLSGITTGTASGDVVRLEAATGDITQSDSIVTYSLGAVSDQGKVDLSLPTNNVKVLASKAVTEVNFQDTVGIDVGTVSAGGQGLSGGNRMFSGSALSGITTGTASDDVVRLEALAGNITQSDSIVTYSLGAVSDQGKVDLSLPTNSVKVLAAKAVTEVNFQDTVGFDVGTVSAGGQGLIGGNRMFSGGSLSGITTGAASGDVVRLEALAGDITQSDSIVTYSLGAVSDQGKADLSLPTNSVKVLAAKAVTEVNFQDTVGFDVGTVSAGGTGLTGGNRMFSGSSLSGITTGTASGDVVRLEALAGDITQSNSIVTYSLGAVSDQGKVDLSLPTNSVKVLAAKAVTEVNFQDTVGFDVGTVSAGGQGISGGNRMFSGSSLSGITTGTASNDVVRLEALAGNITQSDSIVTYSLGAVSDQGKVDLSLPTNSVKVFAAKALTEVDFQDTVGFDVGTLSAGGTGLTGGNRMFSGGSLSGITTGTASNDVVRLEALAGNITQSDSIVTNSLGAVSDQGKVDLSLPTNSVKVFAARAVTEVNFQDTVGFDVGTVSAGGQGLTGGNRMFNGNPISSLSGITTTALTGGVVRLQAESGNVTQSNSIVTNSLGAVSDQGKVDLSLSTNKVGTSDVPGTFAARAATEVNFQDTVGFDVGTVSAGGTGLTGGNRMFSGSSLSGITTGTASNDVVRLEALAGSITQSDSIVTNSLGAVSDQGKVDLSLPTNSVKVLAAKAVTEVNFQDTVGFNVGTVTAGGTGLTGGNRMFSGSSLSGITTGTASDDVVRLEALAGNITQSDSIVTYSLGAVSDQGKADLSLSTNSVKVLAAKALTEVNFQDTVGFNVGTVSAGGKGLTGGNRMFSGSSLSGITTTSTNDGIVRLQAESGDITQSDSIVTNTLGAVSDQGKVDLSLSTNKVGASNVPGTFAARAATEVDFQDSVGFVVGTVNAGGTGLTGGNRMFNGSSVSSLSGISAGTVRLQATSGDITQTQAITSDMLAVIADSGKIDLNLATNNVNLFAAKALKDVTFRDGVDTPSGLVIGAVTNGGNIATVEGVYSQGAVSLTATKSSISRISGTVQGSTVNLLAANNVGSGTDATVIDTELGKAGKGTAANPIDWNAILNENKTAIYVVTGQLTVGNVNGGSVNGEVWANVSLLESNGKVEVTPLTATGNVVLTSGLSKSDFTGTVIVDSVASNQRVLMYSQGAVDFWLGSISTTGFAQNSVAIECGGTLSKIESQLPKGPYTYRILTNSAASSIDPEKGMLLLQLEPNATYGRFNLATNEGLAKSYLNYQFFQVQHPFPIPTEASIHALQENAILATYGVQSNGQTEHGWVITISWGDASAIPVSQYHSDTNAVSQGLLAKHQYEITDQGYYNVDIVVNVNSSISIGQRGIQPNAQAQTSSITYMEQRTLLAQIPAQVVILQPQFFERPQEVVAALIPVTLLPQQTAVQAPVNPPIEYAFTSPEAPNLEKDRYLTLSLIPEDGSKPQPVSLLQDGKRTDKLDLRILEGDQLIEQFKTLPDGRYRLELYRMLGDDPLDERIILETVITNGVPSSPIEEIIDQLRRNLDQEGSDDQAEPGDKGAQLEIIPDEAVPVTGTEPNDRDQQHNAAVAGLWGGLVSLLSGPTRRKSAVSPKSRESQDRQK